MPEKPSYHEPGSTPQSTTSSAAVWAVLIVVGASGLLFLYAVFDVALFFLILFVIAVIGIGGLHFLLWGRQMQAKGEDRTAEDD